MHFLKQLAKACNARWSWRKNKSAQGAKNKRHQKTPVAQGRRDLLVYQRDPEGNSLFLWVSYSFRSAAPH